MAGSKAKKAILEELTKRAGEGVDLAMDYISRMQRVGGAGGDKIEYLEDSTGRLFKRNNIRGTTEDITGTPSEANFRSKMAGIEKYGSEDAMNAARQSEFDERIANRQAEALVDTADAYKMQHTAPRLADDFSGDKLGDAFPDIYTHGKQYYGEGRSFDQKALNVINDMKDNPDASVTMYRAVPPDVNVINEGDWVTTTKEYAEDHARGEEGWKILEKKVKAKDLASDGNSIHEFGYKAAAPAAVGLGALSTNEQAQAYNPSTDPSQLTTGTNNDNPFNMSQALSGLGQANEYLDDNPPRRRTQLGGDYGSITNDEFPFLEQAGDFINKWTQTPIGSPAEGLAEYLKGFGNDDDTQAKATRAFWAAMDVMP